MKLAVALILVGLLVAAEATAEGEQKIDDRAAADRPCWYSRPLALA